MNHRLHPPKVQLQILNDGTREDQITWLCWNDINGIWIDEDRAKEGLPPATKIEVTNAMREIILRNARGIMDDFMPPPLRDDATPSECRIWLKEACKAIGYGFNFENSGIEWENRYGRSFTPEYAAAYDRSLDTIFRVLGDEGPYQVVADEFHRMMNETCDRSFLATL